MGNSRIPSSSPVGQNCGRRSLLVLAALRLGEALHESPSGTMPQLLPCSATIRGSITPLSPEPSSKEFPTSIVSPPCDPRQTSFLQRSPGGSDTEEHGNTITEHHLPAPLRHRSRTRQACSSESSNSSGESSQKNNDSRSCCRSTKGNSCIASEVASKRKAAYSCANGNEGQPGKTFLNNLTCTSSRASKIGIVTIDVTNRSGVPESIERGKAKIEGAEKIPITTGGNSMQFGTAKHWKASAWPPVTSSTGDGSSGERGGVGFFTADRPISEQHLRELRLLCRLIGLHSRPRLQKGQRINVYLHGSGTGGKGAVAPSVASAVGNTGGDSGGTAPCNLGLSFSSSLFLERTRSYDSPLRRRSSEEIKVLGGVDIGANTKCLFFLNDNEDHLYICFNWYDPKSVLDIVSLSCRLASNFRLHPTETPSSLDEHTTLNQIPFLEAARRSALAFWNHREFQDLLQEGGFILRSSIRPAGRNAGGGDRGPLMQTACIPPFRLPNFSSNLQAITCGGFSIGGPTAFYIASLLSTEISPDVPLGAHGGQVRVKKDIIMITFYSTGVEAERRQYLKTAYVLRIRAVAFGSPRFCGQKFVRWCERHLAPSSCSVILYSTAQHSQREPLEHLQELGQKHQGAWDGTSLKPSPTTAESFEHPVDNVTKEQRMILDPVCVQGSADEGFVVQPSTLLLKVGGGLMRMEKQHEEEAAREAEEVTLNSSSIMWNMATRVSPFTKVYNERYAMLHSVLRYYEALADT